MKIIIKTMISWIGRYLKLYNIDEYRRYRLDGFHAGFQFIPAGFEVSHNVTK